MESQSPKEISEKNAAEEADVSSVANIREEVRGKIDIPIDSKAIKIEDVPEKPLLKKANLEQADPRMARLLDNTPESFIENHPKVFAGLPSELSQVLENDFQSHPLTRERYERIILDRDQNYLTDKSIAQLRALEKEYYADVPLWNIRKRMNYTKKARAFEKWIDDMSVTRTDTASKTGAWDEFLAPIHSGAAQSFGTPDASVKAQEYVYCTLSGIPHDMTGEREAVRVKWNPDTPAELVMMDISKQADRHNHDNTTMTYYMNNIFDVPHGKKILAYYLAYAFDRPEDAVDFIKGNQTAAGPQFWDQKADWYADNPFVEPEVLEKMRHETQRMKRLDALFGLEPPLNMEIRIHERATIQK